MRNLSVMALAGLLLVQIAQIPPVLAQQSTPLEQAAAIARGLGPDQCTLQHESEQKDWTKPELYKISYKLEFDQSDQQVNLVRVPCWMGAYNQGDVYILIDSSGYAELVSFAVPSYTVTYENEDSYEVVKSIVITGYTAKTSVVLSDFDPQRLEISEFYKSRGLGDAGTSAIWRFDDGAFILKSYSVDASLDGEINPSVLVSFEEPR